VVKSGRQKGGQELPQGVDNFMRHVLRAGTEIEHGKKLRKGIDGQPQPQHLLIAAQPGAQFVQLEMRDVEVAEAALMEDLSVSACASEPRGDGGLTVAEDPFGSGSIQSTSRVQTAPLQLDEKGFSDGTRGCGAGH
jgi:hypothetical protein